ncbi:hypothetical protein AVEN_28045-1 [Araneus ventricosus]|uniref:Uncharacterized protein n=1 Tax=Araneus ventricosus TaxID=182803 RepID=A0A4Y2BI62_ARAVE|nr:hypothetical protein AVEN_28045-1 [Araneus ventricosus]
MMFNRRLKTKLRITNKFLNPELFNEVRKKLIERQNKQKYYRYKSAHPVSELKPGKSVKIRNFKRKIWELAKIISKHVSIPKTYFLTDRSGRTFRRNPKHILKSNIPFIEEIYHNDDVINDPLQETPVPVNTTN